MSPRPEIPLAKSWPLFKWLWKDFLRPYRMLMAGAFVLMTIEGSTAGALSYVLKPMFDKVFVDGDQSAMKWVGMAILAIFLTRAITGMAQKLLMTYIGQHSVADIQYRLLQHVMQLDTTFHSVHPPGHLMSRVQGDVGGVSTIWSALIQGLGRDVVAVISLIGVALYMDWAWTLIALIGVPITIAPIILAQRFVRSQSRAARELAGQVGTRLDEVFHGITQIKLNSLERYQSLRYNTLRRRSIALAMRTGAGRALIPGMVDIMAGAGFVAVLYFGGNEIISGEKTIGEFMSFFTAMTLAFEPLRRLANLGGSWQTAAASLERVQALFETKPSITTPALPARHDVERPEIRFDDVHLAYGDLPVLRGASFVAEAGKTTALVGASGAGKSTIFNVLTRLIDPNTGDVLLGGVSTRQLELSALRGQFSVVTQDALLFDETLRENILLGRTDVSEAQLNEVLQAAHVSEFLPQLPKGLDSEAGPRGSNLSGGQRQRVAIARALLRDTPVLLLDEATSALDTRSESVVQAAIDRLSSGRTTLVIAHRLSTIRNADKILVMDYGQVVEQGTHDELLDKGGMYSDLYRLQFRSKQDPDANTD
ncbi:ABC transporter ATP-binding protein [Pseudoruegeria sp. SK021]|uniref:ABC transporter ATP-binding protein n=1 Tax=Pseudoruegeria sp. SK021 TaxID=1933035 RepID=UPI000A247EF3|nr:ABC transporter ATP-binding protein [Pseudoruegeria sp. SK021]OSP56181.1 ABC transporter ATP-binding protein [Pseudoruegeria sp. SK021]